MIFKKSKSKTGYNNQEKGAEVGILIVNGGGRARVREWLELCLQRINKHTTFSKYRIYIWNNNIKDKLIPKTIKKFPHTLLIQANSNEELDHIHATPLQRLYERALQDKVKYVVTMDTDAFPIKDEWLRYLIQKLDSKTVISGIWRDELKKGIEPYIHPSCLCTTVDFIESHQLRFDDVDVDIELGKNQDTLTHFSDIARRKELKLFKLPRSNKNELHYLMGGIYGDMVYHQGAASRKGALFWGEHRNEEALKKNNEIRDSLEQFAIEHGGVFIDWLMGKNQVHQIARTSDTNKIYVTGAPEIVSDYLTACLKRIGFGDVGYLPVSSLSAIHYDIPLIAIYTYPLSDIEISRQHDRLNLEQQIEGWERYASYLKRLREQFYYPLLQFDPLSPDLFFDIIFQLSIELGKNPDINCASDLIKKWPGDKIYEGVIARSCQDLFHYLKKHTYRIKPGSFAFQILQRKKKICLPQ